MCEARTAEMHALLFDLDVGHEDEDFRPVGQANVGVQLDLPLFHDPFKRLYTHSLVLDLNKRRDSLNFFLDLRGSAPLNSNGGRRAGAILKEPHLKPSQAP